MIKNHISKVVKVFESPNKVIVAINTPTSDSTLESVSNVIKSLQSTLSVSQLYLLERKIRSTLTPIYLRISVDGWGVLPFTELHYNMLSFAYGFMDVHTPNLNYESHADVAKALFNTVEEYNYID